jgi:hypothetical protein
MAQFFDFNLLPKKSKDLIEKESKRDSYSMYYSFLILFGVVIWLGLVLFNSLVVDRSRKQWEEINVEKENKIHNEYIGIREIHGELVAKTNSIAPIISKDIDPEALFLVADEVFPINEGNVRIVGYGRNPDGTFSIDISTKNYALIGQKARRLKNLDIVSELQIDEISYSAGQGNILASFNFTVDTSNL